MTKETITVFDQQGQPREIPRAEFMEKALPKLLEAAWNDANQLYQQVVFALNEGLHAGVIGAAQRLDELDHGTERSRVLLAATLFQNGRQEEAEAAIRGCIAKSGENAVTVINLARIRAGRGDEAEAEKLLARALELDPNQENALGWRCQQLQQSGGDDAVVALLEELRAQPGRWRAQLWLAQHRLRTGAHEAALALLPGCVAQAANDPGALLALTSDLGKANQLAEMVALCLPLYDERRQRPEMGMNLLQALTQLGRTAEAKALYARLEALKFAPLGAGLKHFAQHLGLAAPVVGAPGAPGVAAQPQQQKLEIRLFVVQGPLWIQGLGAPWLGGEKEAQAPLVTFVGFCDETLSDGKGGKPQVDEERGRLTRALPMYLCESVHLRTEARADMVVPLLPGGAFVVTGQLWPIEALLKGRPAEQKSTYVVQGLLAKDEGGQRVELVIYDGQSGAELHRLRAIGLRRLAGVALRMEDELLDWLEQRGIARSASKGGLLGKLLGGRKKDGPDVGARPSSEKQDHHLLALAHLLGLSVAAIGLGSRESLPDERAMIETCFDLAKGDPKSGAAKPIAACALLFALRLGSTHTERFKTELAALIEADDDPHGTLRMLAPALWFRLGDPAKAESARAERLTDASGVYKLWLEALKA